LGLKIISAVVGIKSLKLFFIIKITKTTRIFLCELCASSVFSVVNISVLLTIFYHRVHREGTEYHRNFIISYTKIKVLIVKPET